VPAFDLTGLNALVCGASQGIGKATAEFFAQQGAKVFLLARNFETLEKTRLELKNPELQTCIAADLAKSEDIESALRSIHKITDTIHILVNNAGGPPASPLLTAQPAAFEAALTTHILSQLQLSQALIPRMKEARFGRIINIISTSVRVPIAGLGVSNTIRAATAGFAKTLSNELAPFGITVNNVLPGFTQTERLTTLAHSAASRDRTSVEEVMDGWLKQVPMRRFAEPAEVAATLGFLASREAGYITGVSLQVDGGRIGAI
jgi:3-oxoacyl-[acyl-carrier protein] reductase